MSDAQVPDETMTGMQRALETLTQLAHERAHREHPGRFGPSGAFADADAGDLEAEKDTALADLQGLADTTGLTRRQVNAFRTALACAVANFIEHAQSTLTTQWHLEQADKRGIRLPATSPNRTRALEALEGVSRCAADIGVLVSAPHAAELLDILDILEGAFTLEGIGADQIAEAVGAYIGALPPGSVPGVAFGLLLGNLHRLGVLEANPRASAHDRNEAHAGIMAARTGVVQWHAHQWEAHRALLFGSPSV
jgi:hypothetical protein